MSAGERAAVVSQWARRTDDLIKRVLNHVALTVHTHTDFYLIHVHLTGEQDTVLWKLELVFRCLTANQWFGLH